MIIHSNRGSNQLFPSSLNLSPSSLPQSSQRAKEVAWLFLENLMHESVEHPAKQTPLLSDEEKTRLVNFLSPQVLREMRRSMGDLSYGESKRAHVLEEFPKLVFRVMPLKAARVTCANRSKLLETALRIQDFRIQIPQAELIEFEREKIGVYVEKKLPLLKKDCVPEFWARVLAHYNSPQATPRLKANLERMIQQLQTIICENGYWYVNGTTLPSIHENGYLCGIDFDDMCSNKTSRHYLAYTATGLKRLAKMIPLPLTIGIRNNVKPLDPSERTDIGYIQKQMENLQRALAIYDGCHDVKEDRTRELEKPLNCASLTAEQKVLAETLHSKLIPSNESPSDCLRMVRHLETVSSAFPDCETSPENFTVVLDFLLTQKKVISWNSERVHDHIRYNIYF